MKVRLKILEVLRCKFLKMKIHIQTREHQTKNSLHKSSLQCHINETVMPSCRLAVGYYIHVPDTNANSC